MISPHLQRGKESRKSRTPPHITSESHIDSPHHERGIYQSPHLSDMSSPDNQEEVCREPIHSSTNNCDIASNTHHDQHQPHRQHSEEDKGGRSIHHLGHPTNPTLNNLRRILDINKIGRHPREHRAAPLRILTGTLTSL